MKNLVVVLIIFCIFISCTKETETICESQKCELLGSWNWIRTYGSIAGQTWTPASTGIVKKIEINDDVILFYESGIIVDSYPYIVFETDTIFRGSEVYKFIRYNNNTRWYKLEGNKLEIHDTCFDCYDDYYDRK